MSLCGNVAQAAGTGDVGQCQRPASPVAEAQRKFHPGHYLSVGKVEARKGFAPGLSGGIAGIQLRYRWADLEPEEGRYDLAPIARDLLLAKRSGWQLVAVIEDKSFNQQLPTPQYLQQKHTIPSRNRGFTAVRWDPYVNDRLIRLVKEIGTQFDCDPNFEGIAFQETALSLDDSVLAANGYTPERYRDALIKLLNSASASLPRSRVFWYMNFLPGGQQYIGDIAAAVAGKGVVMGGPDVLPDNQALARRTYPYYEKFNGRLKLFCSMQHASYRHRRESPASAGAEFWSMEDLFVFARDKLHVDYLFWEYRTKRDPPGSNDWQDAREVIVRHPQF